MKRFCAKILSVVLILSCLFGSVACSPHEHVWGEWQTETGATCVAKGKEVRYCLDNSKHKEERETYAIERFWNHAFCVDEQEWMKKSEEYSEYKQL